MNKNLQHPRHRHPKKTISQRYHESKGINLKESQGEDLKYVCNTNGWQCYRKIENGKGVWFAHRQDDDPETMIPISYEQARGFEDMPNPTEIEKLQRKFGKMLLPQREEIDYKNPEVPNGTAPLKAKLLYLDGLVEIAKRTGDPNDAWAVVDYVYDQNLSKAKTYSLTESKDDPHTYNYKGYTIQVYDDNGYTVYKNGKKIQEFSSEEDAEEYIDGLSEGIGTGGRMIYYICNYPDRSPVHLDGYQTAGFSSEDAAKAGLDAIYNGDGGDYYREHYPNLKVSSRMAYNVYHESLKRSIKSKLSEADTPAEAPKPTLDYEAMMHWNPVAIGAKVAEFLGIEASPKQVRSEINKIIVPEEYRMGGGDYKKARKKAFTTAMRDIQFEREKMNEDPMDGHKYRVSGASPNVTETGTDFSINDAGYFEDPKEAIEAWMKLSKNDPHNVSIDTNNDMYASELLSWVVSNEPEFIKMYQTYQPPYEMEYLIDKCKAGMTQSFNNKYNYPDQIDPFSLG